MLWKKIEDELPESSGVFLVKINCGRTVEVGVAEYSIYFGFSPEISAYNIYCHDDSGLSVDFNGEIVAWSKIEF